ncbi:hypothetical protein E8E14_008313 [Neopestalotiopsis sp. 37M]|nr:hypothetical protein E8E14_008313 [Neopestalotiopsis sp. 37M]
MGKYLDEPVIIAGAGLVGLTLAQALKQAGIPYAIYERDDGLRSRYGGWGITLHWALRALHGNVPSELLEQIRAITNDPEAMKQGKSDSSMTEDFAYSVTDSIPFRFLDLETGLPKFEAQLPPSLRVSRLKLREILCQGIDINWGKSVVQWKEDDSGVIATLSDGTQIRGSLLAAADGKNSKIKSELMGTQQAQLHHLPVGFIGLKLRLPASEMKPFTDIAPILWQGAHPHTKYFVFFSPISSPDVNGSAGSEQEYHEAQLNLSWLQKTDDSESTALLDKLGRFKEAAREGCGFFPVLRDAIEAVPQDVEILNVSLQDWATQSWRSVGGRVTILGDAAHPMTMYRGEAANHGMYDAVQLTKQLLLVRSGQKSAHQAVANYEEEMVRRGHKAVLLSRQACFDGHDLQELSLDSPLFQGIGEDFK